ncbi:MAG: FecR domain-containing protein [Gammaproteobacteria bacterium]
MKRRGFLVAATLAAVMLCGDVAAAPGVGKVVIVTGSTMRQAADGTRTTLARGDRVFEQDRITTAADSSIFLRFDDDTRFTLGPRTEFVVDQVRDDDEGLFSASILRGAFRFVTGLIAKKRAGAMRVRTGVVATIGIRGTTVGGEVEGESATIVLLESEDPGTPSAIEVGNDFGSVVIDQPGYGTRVPDAHSPPSPPERMTLRAVDNLVRNITNIQRSVAPRPMMPR